MYFANRVGLLALQVPALQVRHPVRSGFVEFNWYFETQVEGGAGCHALLATPALDMLTKSGCGTIRNGKLFKLFLKIFYSLARLFVCLNRHSVCPGWIIL